MQAVKEDAVAAGGELQTALRRTQGLDRHGRAAVGGGQGLAAAGADPLPDGRREGSTSGFVREQAQADPTPDLELARVRAPGGVGEKELGGCVQEVRALRGAGLHMPGSAGLAGRFFGTLSGGWVFRLACHPSYLQTETIDHRLLSSPFLGA